MSEALFSPLWYRVSALKPQVRRHVEMHRHDYRGLIWYILEDKASGRTHRFNATAYQVIGLLDGKLTMDQIWNMVNDRLGDFAPTQDQMIQLLGKLHTADLLQAGLPADTDELFQRGEQNKSNKLKQRAASPLSIKIPLWDPDAFLKRHLRKVAWLFDWYAGIVIILFIMVGGLTAAVNWQAITSNLLANSLSPYNLGIMLVLYPGLKFLHELGHAFSARYYGGEVHEIGISFLVFMPIPYVDVSSVNSLRNRKQRIVVSAAGILVELCFATLGLVVWLESEAGMVKDFAFNLMLIGGASSLFFNGNPLLKYDGYYMLADALGMPNLFQRSSKYLGYLCQKHLFGVQNLSSPATAPGEPGWFVVYSLSSFVYRIGLLWVIVVYLIDTFFVIGVVLAVWAVATQLLWPLLKALNFIFYSQRLHQQRARVLSSVGILVVILWGLLFALPVPSYTRSEGTVWMPEEALLRAETAGFAGNLLVPLPTSVDKGTGIIDIHDPLLDTEVDVLYAKLRELNTQFRAEWEHNRVKADNIKEEMLVIGEQLKEAKKNQQAMQISSKKSGNLLLPQAVDLPGKFVRKGEVIGYVIDDTLPIVRVMVAQTDIGQIQKHIKNVQIRLVNEPQRVLPATIIRRAPEATNFLSSPALAAVNGGKIAIDPDFTEQIKTQEKVFQIDLEFTPPSTINVIGQRVFVRFDHGAESLAQQWYRSFRQLFLRRFRV
jgi:putative peptide zinc metalloprotease protein